MPYSYGLENLVVYHWGEKSKLVIGSFCSIALNVQVFLGGNHRSDWVTTYPFGWVCKDIFPWVNNEPPATHGDVVIGSDVWIGSHSTILSGVTIGDGSVIGCHAVVAKSVPPYSVVAGNPARVVKKRFSDAQIEGLMRVQWWGLPIEHIRQLIPLLLSNKVDDLIAAAAKFRGL